jgi:hypothetical protein
MLRKTDRNTFRMLIYIKCRPLSCHQTCFNFWGSENQTLTAGKAASVCVMRRCAICMWSKLRTNWWLGLIDNSRVLKLYVVFWSVPEGLDAKQTGFILCDLYDYFTLLSFLKEKTRSWGAAIILHCFPFWKKRRVHEVQHSFSVSVCPSLNFWSTLLIFMKYRAKFVQLEHTPMTQFLVSCRQYHSHLWVTHTAHE